MDFFSNIKQSWFAWLKGSPPIDEAVLETVHDQFHILLYVACIFFHAKHWIRNLILYALYLFVLLFYVCLLIITATKQIDDFITASQTIHMAVLGTMALTMLVFLNYYRQNMIDIFRAMCVNFYDYGDDFEIPEMIEEYKRTRRQKVFILIAVPTYLAMTAFCCLLGRTVDAYFGYGSDEEFINDIYQLTPVPIWYPIKPQGKFMQYFLIFSQAVGANTMAVAIAGSDAFLIFATQSFQLQFKILIYRLRKIEEIAYKLHRKNGGKELTADQMYDDPSFLECYYACLKKSAQHHVIIIKNYDRLKDLVVWPGGIAAGLGSLLIAMSLLAIILGGGSKPSILSLAAMLIIAEVLNMAMICMVSEELKETGESLHEELYDLNWQDTNVKIKRIIMIIIERSKDPLVLVAGLTPLNWETFSSILNSAYGYVNILVASMGSGGK